MVRRGGTANTTARPGANRTASTQMTPGRPLGQEMSESQVVAFLGRKILQAMNTEEGDLSDVRQENFNHYVGAEYGDEREGYSRFVTREAMETIEWVLPSVLRVFLSGDRIVSFEPQGPEDEEKAKQETDQTNYFVMRANNKGAGAFLPLHDWIKDALMYPNGYLKVHMREYSKTDVGIVTGINAIGLQMLEEDPDVELLAQRSRTVLIPSQLGFDAGQQQMQFPKAPDMLAGAANEQQMTPLEVFDLKIRTTKDVTELAIEAVPPEQCLIDNDCTSLNLDEADFVCHRVRKTFTQLVEEGFDPDALSQVGSQENYQYADERTNRLFYEDEDPDAEDEDDPSMRVYWVHECYAQFDYDGDGLAEQRTVTLIGDRVFDNEETNYQPMVALSAILMQHKHTGMGYIELVKDLQLLISVLTRQMLDSIYRSNTGKKFISEDALTDDGSTMEAMYNTQAEYVPVRGNPQHAVAPDIQPSIVQEILPVIQHVDASRASRTGITPESGVAANDLQEVRAEVFSNALDRASQRIEMLVRIFAETGFRWLMLKVHQLLRSHWDIEKTIKLRGKWVDVDPQGWRDRTDMAVEVGLGFNTKTQIMGMLVQLIAMQKEAAQYGLSDPAKIYHTLDKLINASGLGDVRSFFSDPEEPGWQPPQPQPDANMIIAQAQAQALEREANRKDAELQIKAQTDAMSAQAQAQKAQADAQSAAADREIKIRELALKEFELNQNKEFSQQELDAKIEEIRASTQLKYAQADKAIADAAAVAVEASETFQQAQKIVAKGGEMSDAGELAEGEIELEPEGDDE